MSPMPVGTCLGTSFYKSGEVVTTTVPADGTTTVTAGETPGSGGGNSNGNGVGSNVGNGNDSTSAAIGGSSRYASFLVSLAFAYFVFVLVRVAF
jgi:hypothetical protein